MDKNKQTEIEAQVFRDLVEHFQNNTDVQNIDLMNLANFCRNCLSKWYVKAAEDQGEEVDYDAAREVVYGMPYSLWKEKYQKEATADQKALFDKNEAKRIAKKMP